MISKKKLLQLAIIKNFAPRYIKGGSVLYLNGNSKKDLFIDEKRLNELGVPLNQLNKLPDAIIYDNNKDWLFLIEAIISKEPMSPKRVVELEELLKDCNTGKIYVSVFKGMDEYRKHIENIAWETHVWLADNPDHMIHHNGGKFIMPRNRNLVLSQV